MSVLESSTANYYNSPVSEEKGMVKIADGGLLIAD